MFNEIELIKLGMKYVRFFFQYKEQVFLFDSLKTVELF